jgi:DNA-binding transcriptional MerR regulator
MDETKIDKLLRPGEVAKILRVNPSTISVWRREGVGPPWVKVGGRFRYPEAKLLSWIEQEQGE